MCFLEVCAACYFNLTSVISTFLVVFPLACCYFTVSAAINFLLPFHLHLSTFLLLLSWLLLLLRMLTPHSPHMATHAHNAHPRRPPDLEGAHAVDGCQGM